MNSRVKFFVVFASTSLAALLLVGAVIGKSASPGRPLSSPGRLHRSALRIKSRYVEEPDMKSVTLGALNGLLQVHRSFSQAISTRSSTRSTEEEGRVQRRCRHGVVEAGGLCGHRKHAARFTGRGRRALQPAISSRQSRALRRGICRSPMPRKQCAASLGPPSRCRFLRAAVRIRRK